MKLLVAVLSALVLGMILMAGLNGLILESGASDWVRKSKVRAAFEPLQLQRNQFSCGNAITGEQEIKAGQDGETVFYPAGQIDALFKRMDEVLD